MFSLNSYFEILNSAKKKGYEFIPYSVDFKNINENDGLCILRHDIDADLEAAVKLAKVEQELGVKSTYFLMCQSPVYNLFSRWNIDYVNSIISMGHNIGLHYDRGFDLKSGLSTNETSERIKAQTSFLENVFHCKIDAVSFHQPDEQIVKQEFKVSVKINTYDFELLKNFQYYSDSNREFKLAGNELTFIDSLALRYPTNIQLLTHPIWWVYDPESTENAWNEAIISNLRHMQLQMLETERAYGNKRQFFISKG